MENEYTIADSQAISKLFQTFKAHKIEILLRHELNEYTATVYKVSDVAITLFYRGDIPEDIKSIELSAVKGQTVYFANCNIVSISHSEVTIAFPDELEKGVKRKYNRVETKDDVFLKFNVISNVEAKFNVDDSSHKLPPQFVSIYKELLEPIPSIKKILPLLAQELKKKAPLFEIKLYKDDVKDSKRIEVLKKFKKTIYITNVKDSKVYLKDIQQADIMSFLPHIQDLKADELKDIKDELIQIMKEDMASSAISYICSPIKLFAHVIGHIFLGLAEGSHQIFRDQDIYFVQLACDIISEALAKVKLHQLDTGEEYDIPVLDLSAGGLSMEFNDPFILKHLTKDMKLKVGLKINEKELNGIVKIIRIDTREDNNSEVALKFTEIRWVDQEYIDTYVSRKIGMEKMQQKQQKG